MIRLFALGFIWAMACYPVVGQQRKKELETSSAFLYGIKLTTQPARMKATSKVKIVIDVSNDPSLAHARELFIWAWKESGTGAFTNASWDASHESQRLKPESTGVFSFSMIPSQYYAEDPTRLEKIQFLIKTKTGDAKSEDFTLFIGKTVEESDLLANLTHVNTIVSTQPVQWSQTKGWLDLQALPKPSFKKMETAIGVAKLKVDPRLELLYTLGLLNGYPFITPKYMEYKTKIIAALGNPSMATEVMYLRKIFSMGSIDGPVFFMLNLDENLEPLPSMSLDMANSLGGPDSVVVYLQRLRKFCASAGYDHFFNSQEPFFDLMLRNAHYAFAQFKGIEQLEGYYGMSHSSYAVVLNTLFQNGNFGVSATDHQGNTHLSAVIEPSNVENGIPVFRDVISTNDLIFHEFSHSFVNPLVDKMARQVAKYSYLFKPIKKEMAENGYQFWHVTVKEQMVRAITCRLGVQRYGQEIASRFFEDNELARGFVYTQALVDKLRYYEANRTTYRTFDTFFPELLLVFDGITPAYVGEQHARRSKLQTAQQFSTPSRISTTDSFKDAVLVVSTHERTQTGQQAVNELVAQLNGSLGGALPVMTDVQALEADLTGKNIHVVGTIEGNLFAKKYFQDVPISLTNTGIFTDRPILGSNLQLMVTWTNPVDPSKSTFYYTAQNAEDIKDYLYVPYKGGHFWIGTKSSTLDMGEFRNSWNRWLPASY
jgi:hypothetical protein